MVVHNRKKNTRQHGYKTHGYGAMKKHRGAGHRGGRGAAGSGKRGDAKKPSIWGNLSYAGKHGFISRSRTPNVPITIAHLESFTKTLVEKGIVMVEGSKLIVNLEAAGYTKLLASGKPSKKWTITVGAATSRAIEKIKKAGGTVTLTESVLEAEGSSPNADEE